MIWVGALRERKGGRRNTKRMALLTLLFLEIIMPTPKPELWAETNFPQAPWKNVTLWCRSPSGSTKEFVLLKDGTGWIATRPASEQVRAAFPLGALTQSHTGSYHCHSWEEMAVSEPSEALELVGTGKRKLRVLPECPWNSCAAESRWWGRGEGKSKRKQTEELRDTFRFVCRESN